MGGEREGLPVVARAAVAVLWIALTGCSEKRFACEACVGDVCARPSTPGGRRLEDDARCMAAESLCGTLEQKGFDRYCKDKQHTLMLGCSKEVLSHFRFNCTSKTHLRVPLLIDL